MSILPEIHSSLIKEISRLTIQKRLFRYDYGVTIVDEEENLRGALHDFRECRPFMNAFGILARPMNSFWPKFEKMLTQQTRPVIDDLKIKAATTPKTEWDPNPSHTETTQKTQRSIEALTVKQQTHADGDENKAEEKSKSKRRHTFYDEHIILPEIFGSDCIGDFHVSSQRL